MVGLGEVEGGYGGQGRISICISSAEDPHTGPHVSRYIPPLWISWLVHAAWHHTVIQE